MTKPRAILLDLDGTLTEPLLDFDLIRREMGINGATILEALAQMPHARRQLAESVLLRHEQHAAENATLNSGCEALLSLIEGRLPAAIITRNSLQSTQTVCRIRNLRFALLVTRELGAFKPSPEPLLHACRALDVAPTETWMVGDGQFDVEAGLAAGAHTIWLSHGREKRFPAEPHTTVADLHELTRLLEDCLDC